MSHALYHIFALAGDKPILPIPAQHDLPALEYPYIPAAQEHGLGIARLEGSYKGADRLPINLDEYQWLADISVSTRDHDVEEMHEGKVVFTLKKYITPSSYTCANTGEFSKLS